MAIDYIVNCECEVKKALTQEMLTSKIKAKELAEQIIKNVEAKGKTFNDALKVVVERERDLQGSEPVIIKQTVKEILEEVQELEQYELVCKKCAVSKGEAFGCYKCIHYPISEKAEHWIVRMAQEAMKAGGAAAVPLQMINKFGVSGQSYKNARQAGNSFFQLGEAPAAVTLNNGFLKKKKIDTNQIFELMFNLPILEKEFLLVFLSFSGAMRIVKEEPKLNSEHMMSCKMTDDNEESWLIFDMADHEDDDLTILELKEFFRTLFTAFAMNYTIAIES